MSTRLTKHLFKHPEGRSIGQWIRNKKGFLMLFFLLIFVICLLIKPASYTITHFQAKDCGTIGSGLSSLNKAFTGEDIQCFISAHQHCSAATLSINDTGVDRGSQETYRTANGLGNCTLSVIAYAKGCPYEILCDLIPYIDTNCRTLAERKERFYLINCGNQRDIVLPT